MTDEGAPPRTGWAKIVPELLVQCLGRSLGFWSALIGFDVAYRRPEQGFVYLERPEGAQLMLCERSGHWETGPLEPPFGRGVMLQVYVDELQPVLDRIVIAGWPVHTGLREVWRRHGDREGGQRELFVQDPDGYLAMLAQPLGHRPLPEAS